MNGNTLASIPTDDTSKSSKYTTQNRLKETLIVARGRGRFGVFLRGGLRQGMGSSSLRGFSTFFRAACSEVSTIEHVIAVDYSDAVDVERKTTILPPWRVQGDRLFYRRPRSCRPRK